MPSLSVPPLWYGLLIAIQRAALAALVAVMILDGTIIAVRTFQRLPDSGDETTISRSGDSIRSGGAIVAVDNRVTSGAEAAREDSKPLRLFWAPSVCFEEPCAVPHNEFGTGDKISGVVCQTTGARITNGNDENPADDRNPALTHSPRWYGVQMESRRLAYVSEVWIAAGDRGGLGLPTCS
jgi:hypothetical protein